MMSKYPLLTVFVALLTVTACNNKGENTVGVKKQVKPVNAIAKVDESYITRDYLDVVKVRILGKRPSIKDTPEFDGKMLDSVIQSRAMSIVIENDLNEQELAKVDLQVAAYREELMVKEYLRRKAKAKPISQSMIKDFYEKNPGLFGATTRKELEMLKVRVPTGEAAIWTKRLESVYTAKDWKHALSELGVKGESVKHSVFTYRKGLLGNDLDRIIKPLSKDSISQLHLVKNTFYVIKVLDEKTSQAQPLSQVAGQVRKYLMPQVLSKAIEQSTNDLMTKVSVERY